ncbi:MAG: enzyme of heme biosynthesis [Rikenellaceae bacterium]
MKRITLLLMLAFVAVTGAMAQGQQVDFSNPAYAKWGENVEDREKNMFSATFMREALDSKSYDEAAGYFQTLMANCPSASEAVIARGVVLYKAKIARSKSMAEKRTMVDSLMLVHDLRLQHFSTHPTRGTKYILDSKARDFYNYNKSDREGLREVFRASIEAAGESADLEFVNLYFVNLCEDYKMDEVMADEVIAEYDRLTPLYEKATAEQAELVGQFDSAFGNSGVASCENLEAIFAKKLEASPDDEKVLAQAVKLMDRAGCRTAFYAQVAESYYRIRPSSVAAMALAAIFQNDGDFDKASKYLRDALESETDIEEQEKLYSRIALIELGANRSSAALEAARKAVAIQDGTRSDNGIALFVIAQCYGTSAANCPDFQGQIAYLAAYDAMQAALNNFSADEASYKAPATSLLSQFKAYFPTKEECFFNEIELGSSTTVQCGVAKGVSTVVRTRD